MDQYLSKQERLTRVSDNRLTNCVDDVKTLSLQDMKEAGCLAKTVIAFSYLDWVLGGVVNHRPTHGLRQFRVLKVEPDHRSKTLHLLIYSPDIPALVSCMRCDGSLIKDTDGIPLIQLSYEVMPV